MSIAESSINIFLLIFAVMGPIISLGATVTAGEPVPEIVSTAGILNFLVAGGIMLYGFSAATASLREGL